MENNSMTSDTRDQAKASEGIYCERGVSLLPVFFLLELLSFAGLYLSLYFAKTGVNRALISFYSVFVSVFGGEGFLGTGNIVRSSLLVGFSSVSLLLIIISLFRLGKAKHPFWLFLSALMSLSFVCLAGLFVYMYPELREFVTDAYAGNDIVGHLLTFFAIFFLLSSLVWNDRLFLFAFREKRDVLRDCAEDMNALFPTDGGKDSSFVHEGDLPNRREDRLIEGLLPGESFESLLNRSPSDMKERYGRLFRFLLRYGLGCSETFDGAVFGKKGIVYFGFSLSDLRLRLFGRVNPHDFRYTCLEVNDVSSLRGCRNLPTMYEVGDDLTLERAEKIAAAVMKRYGIRPDTEGRDMK